MNSNVNYLIFVRLCCIQMKKNDYFVIALLFLHYTLLRLKRIKEMKIQIFSISDMTFSNIIKKYYQNEQFYIDATSCGFGVTNCNSKASWINICSKLSKTKYKIFIVPFKDAVENEIYVSETTLFNIQNLLHYNENTSYFLVPTKQEDLAWGDEVKISLLSNPYECPEDLLNTILKNYFSEPRYLRSNDIFHIPLKEYAPEYFLTLGLPQLTSLYFKVNNIKIDGKDTAKPCYIFKSQSTLLQESTVFQYLPFSYTIPILEDRTSNVRGEIEKCNISNFPWTSYKPLEELKASILPFVVSDDWIGIKPVFLIKGPPGSGKHKLIKTVTDQMGFNFYNVDFSEIQTLSPSQTEAKLRIALHNAENSVPCILKISNIQIFRKNSEGRTDERITSNFGEQLDDLYKSKMKLPLIIIATLEGSDIPSDVNRHFIEQIKIGALTLEQRVDLLDWFLKVFKIDHEVDLSKVASMCSDFLYHDIEHLVQYAIKNHYKRIAINETCLINENDFIQAYDYMQSLSSIEIGAPKCPEVYWEDIGGLANLKHEIIRRIEVPLMHGYGIQSSGILFYGPPGTGKTLLAKAVATECKLHFLSVKGPELLNMYVGQSEKNVRDLFERARAASPCIIFFDELDALAPNRGRSGDSGGVMDRVVSQLLAEMDGLGSSTKTFIVGATNRPDLIDPALLRPGRFDKLLYVGVYFDPESQLSVLKAITRKFNMADGTDLDKLVEKLPFNLTGADLHSICSNAWLNSARRVIEAYEKSDVQEKDSIRKCPTGPIVVSANDFLEALATLTPSVSKEELAQYEKLHDELTSRK